MSDLFKLEFEFDLTSLRNLKAALQDYNDKAVEYGLFEDQGSHPSNPGVSYAELMAIHELRPESDPLRRAPFSTALKVYSDKFDKEVKSICEEIVRNSVKGTLDLSPLMKFGQLGAHLTKQVFGDKRFLKETKKGNDPLVLEGYLREAIMARLVKDGN